MTLIVRSYETEQQARDLVRVLEEKQLCEGEVLLVLPPAEAPAGDEAPAAGRAPAVEAVEKAFALSRALGERADGFAQSAAAGRSVVVARPYFGRGLLVTEIMDGFGPVDVPERPAPVRVPYRLPAAPLSQLLLLPVLIRGMPAPLSDALLGIPILSRGRSFISRRYAELTDPDFSLSARLGWRLLSDNPAPLSSTLGLPTKAGGPAPRRTSFGLPLLSSNPAPLSSLLGLRLLSRNPTPLSSAFGWETLQRRDS